MRLLFITRKFPPSVGGMEVYSSELHAALRRIGADVELFRPPQPLLGRPSLAQMGLFFMHACACVVRRRREYDALLIGDFAIASLAPIARVATRGRARIGVSLHGQDLYFMRRRSPAAFVYRAIARLVVASRSIDIAIANSRAIRDEALHRGLANVAVVPLATRLPDTVDGTRATPPYLLFAGRLIAYKGLSWFVEHVWPRLDPRLELHVAGEVWDERERACLEGDPRIRFLGKIARDELPALRAAAVACIMPNRPPGPHEQDEGFGLSALEASAAGTPIVAARTGGLPDAVVDGVTGFLVTPLDADGWVARLNAIASWTDDERQRFAAVARSTIAEDYNWNLVAQRTLALMENRTPTDLRATARSDAMAP